MSLLMDALKKAEAAKRQGAEGTSATAEATGDPSFGNLSLEPLQDSPEPEARKSATDDPASSMGKTAPANLPKLPTHLGALDAEFVAHHQEQNATSMSSVQLNSGSSGGSVASGAPVLGKAAKKPVPPDPKTRADRDAARNLFAAKSNVPRAGNRKFAVAMGMLTIVVTLCAVGYFWLQLQPKSGAVDAGFAVRPAAPITPPVVTAGQGTPQPPVDTTSPPQINSTGTVAATPNSAPKPVAAPAPNQPENRKRVETTVDSADDGAVRLIRVSKSPLQINPALMKGFDSFNRGDFAAAKAEYESVAKVDPQNIDALHGLAAIAVREGRLSVADHFYERILVADPKDAAAMSAMINLHSQNNPVAAESQLKGIASEQPGSASAQFALGNLYASQKRWAEAQQSYFKAYSAEPDNPDILYNLAVSLEYLNQAKLAHQYYVLAMEAGTRRPGGFDMAVAGARAAALKP